jgi:hypothetical protein
VRRRPYQGISIRFGQGDPEDFECPAIIESSAHGPAGDGDPDQLAALGSAKGELTADRGLVVPVVPGDELIGLT